MKNIWKNTLLAGCLCLSNFLAAQSLENLGLDEAIRLALDNRIELKNNRLKLTLAQGQNDKIKARWRPQLRANADLRWNTQLQTTVLPFDITGQNPGGESRVRFGVPFNTLVGIEAEQKVYDPQKRLDLERNRILAENEQVSLLQQQRDIRRSVTAAYYTAVFQSEKLAFARKQYERADADLQVAETRFQSGALLENDLNRIRLSLSNAALNLRKAAQDLEWAKQDLQFEMNTSSTIGQLSLNFQILSTRLDTTLVAELDTKPEILKETISLKVNALDLKKQQSLIRPTIDAYAAYALQQLNDAPNPFAANSWFPYNYIGIRAGIPLYDGRLAKANMADLRLQQEISLNTIAQYQADFQHDIAQSTLKMRQLREDVRENRQNIALAEQVLKTDQFRYEKGALPYSELVASRFVLQEAEFRGLELLRELLEVELAWREALGRL